MTEKDRELALDEWLAWHPDPRRVNGLLLREIQALADLHPGRPRDGETAEAYAARWSGISAARDEHKRTIKRLQAERDALETDIAAKFRAARCTGKSRP